MTSDLEQLAQQALETARQRKLTIVTAESCTAGKLGTLLSEAPGASEFLHGGFITYTKDNKTAALGVDAKMLAERTAVCPDVAIAMAQGALARSPADVAVAITGVAGPDPDEDDNPVGLVCLAVARKGRAPVCVEKRYGNIGRTVVQERAMTDALSELIRVSNSD